MISLATSSLQLFAMTFGIYHAVIGLLNLDSYQSPSYVMIAIVLYFYVLLLTVFYPSGIKLPAWVANLNLTVAVVLPLIVTAGLGSNPQTPYTTWYVAALGTLFAITAVRSHRVVAWIGVGIVIAEVLAFGGLSVLFNAGIIGALLLVMGAQAASNELQGSEFLAQQFRERTLATEAATAAQSAARAERESRVKQTLSGVLPQLSKIVELRGDINPEDKKLALLTEAELRDQIRGRGLMHPALIEATRLARIRGVEVQLLDDGGFEDLEPSQVQEILDRAALELASVNTGKVVIRSVSGEAWRLTMAAIRKGAEQPDLFLRL